MSVIWHFGIAGQRFVIRTDVADLRCGFDSERVRIENEHDVVIRVRGLKTHIRVGRAGDIVLILALIRSLSGSATIIVIIIMSFSFQINQLLDALASIGCWLSGVAVKRPRFWVLPAPFVSATPISATGR